MEIKGKILQALQLQTGMGKKGPWQKQEYVLETQSQYPKKICFSVWSDKIAQMDLWEGDLVTLGIELESREYNGKWYTEVRAWKCEKNGSTRTAGQARAERSQAAPSSTPSSGVADSNDASDDLPFRYSPYVKQY